MSRQRVAYYYDDDFGHFHYGPGHPMKPHRLKLTHHLLLTYGLYRKLHVFRPHRASIAEMTKFHTADYVQFLSRVSPDSLKTYQQQMGKFTVGEYTDCPVFADMFDFCSMYTGASIDGAIRLNHGLADICVNWAGGLHHAKKSEASGFCYINDIVLAILEMLKYHPRVLYIDIDIHHGDGVEEAFYCTDRVMTVSFHKFGDFFPGTGDIKDIGEKDGKYYSVNFPLKEGIDDISYEHVFKPVITKVMEVFRPTAVVLQCGADSLTGDRLGCFNLTVKGHAECVAFVQNFGLPTLVLGGGGYTVPNVARCWAFETATLLHADVEDIIPHNHFHEYFEPEYRLHLEAATMENQNSPEYLNHIKEQIYEHLRSLDHAPSVQFHQVPPDWAVVDGSAEETNPDARDDAPPGRSETGIEHYDGDADQDGEGGLEKVGGPQTASSRGRGRGPGAARGGRKPVGKAAGGAGGPDADGGTSAADGGAESSTGDEPDVAGAAAKGGAAAAGDRAARASGDDDDMTGEAAK